MGGWTLRGKQLLDRQLLQEEDRDAMAAFDHGATSTDNQSAIISIRRWLAHPHDPIAAHSSQFREDLVVDPSVLRDVAPPAHRSRSTTRPTRSAREQTPRVAITAQRTYRLI